MANKKSKNRPVPYQRIAEMWKAGKTYMEMAKAVQRWNPKKPDPTKPVRAIVSNMLTKGYKQKNGKVVKLQPRPQMRNIGVGKTVHQKIVKPSPQGIAR